MFWLTFSFSKPRKDSRQEMETVPISYQIQKSKRRPLSIADQTLCVNAPERRLSRPVSIAEPRNHHKIYSQQLDDGGLLITPAHIDDLGHGLENIESYRPIRRHEQNIYDNNYVTSVYQPSAYQDIIIERPRRRLRSSSRSTTARTTRSTSAHTIHSTTSAASGSSARSASSTKTASTISSRNSSPTPSTASTPSLSSSNSSPSASTSSRRSSISTRSASVTTSQASRSRSTSTYYRYRPVEDDNATIKSYVRRLENGKVTGDVEQKNLRRLMRVAEYAAGRK